MTTTIQGLLGKLHAADVRLRASDGDLVVSGRPEEVDASLIEALKAHKATLLGMMGDSADRWWSPPRIGPDSFPLVSLDQAGFDSIVARVDGGASNIQDIYPLAPLQEGILFHHLMTRDSDPYLSSTLLRFDNRPALDRYVAALRAVVSRHDILRTAVIWEGLKEPVQVVWREAPLQVEDVEVESDRRTDEQLFARLRSQVRRIDLGKAPLMRLHVTRDEAEDRWFLLLLWHHLISDHTTMDVLRSEIAAHLAGNEGALPEPRPFRDYVAHTLSSADRDEHRAFFTEMLGDVEEPTAPFGLMDVQGDGSDLEETRVEVDAALATRLKACARTLGVTAASLFHVAWAKVLGTASGGTDVVFGTLLFGRMHAGTGGGRTMGPFINTLPIRVRVGEDRAPEVVRRTHVTLAQLLRHEHASLALAQRCSGVDAPAPLFTALLNYRHSGRSPSPNGTPSPRPSSAGARLIRGDERTNYPLTLSVDDLGERFWLTVRTRAPLDPARVSEMVRRALEGLVSALESAPPGTLAAIDVLPEDERSRLLEEWNRTEADYPRGSCVHELFESQAGRTPEAVALVSEAERLTYGEVNRRANRLARHLRSLGVGPDVRVGICLERSPEMVVGLLGVLKAGGAYVPLDPRYPAERLAYMLSDGGPAVVLTQSGAREGRHAGLFDDLTVPVLELDAATPAWAEREHTNLERGALTPDHLAYVMYTSGSTGRPKGVMVQHRGLVNRLTYLQRDWGLNPGDSILQSTTLSFDVSAYEIFWPIAVGGHAVLAKPAGQMDPAYVVSVVARERIGTVNFVPSMLQVFLDLGGLDAASCLKRVPCGGEALPPALARRFRERLPRVALHNRYGPTESAVAAVMTVSEHEAHADRVPVGRPRANTRLYVLDWRGDPVPVGVTGELYIGGVGVARGYQGRPELTAERFVADPFGPPGTRLYRTGDSVRWLADGTLEFLGRRDHQVKVRGFRIELGEIEARLRDHAQVADAVVLAREDRPGEVRLVAYYVGTDAVEAEGLRAHLGERIPEYMVPAAYVRMEAFPLTPNGKLDRKALPRPDADAFAAREYEAPRDEAEQILADIWSEVLGVERVGRSDNFFELGGHSLLAVQTMTRVQHVLGVKVELGDIFSRPVLSDLARVLTSAAKAELPPIERVCRDGPLPLSFAQQRLWFLERLGNLGSTYNVATRMHLRGELDREALVGALDRIVARHGALRTTFTEVDGVAEQRIAPADSGFRLEEHDLGEHPDAKAEFRRLVAAEARATFDLEEGPLIRGRLVRFAEDDHLLLLTMHHIVSDGWSSGILTRELGTLYGAFRRGEPDPLPSLPIQYSDYAVWQRRWIEDEVLEEQSEYWMRTLAGAPPLLALPTDRPRPGHMDHGGAWFGFGLDERLVTDLKRLSRRHGMTLFMTLLAGWTIVLSRLSGQVDVVVGTPVANRGRREIEGLIGFFVNTLALRMDLSGSPTVSALLERVKARVLEGQHHQDLPFEHVVEMINPARSLAHTPVFQVMFAWQAASPELEVSPRDLQMDRVGGGAVHAPAKFDLSLALRETGDRIVGGLTYATSLFDSSTIEGFVECLRRALEEMVVDPRQLVEAMDLMPAGERAKIVDDWNRTAAAYPSESTAHERFETLAADSPEATALVYEGEHVSYGELDSRANRLAHHLCECGVAPDVRVGICAQRSPEMIVGLLAVLKAGGAYVPLDPTYPPERLAYMLADSAPAAVLTTESIRTDRASVFAAIDVPVLALDAADPEWRDRPATQPPAGRLNPDHLAYVTYTSGSTGRPKGVMNPHRGLVNRVHWLQEKFGLGTGERVLQNSSFSFDASVFEILWPLSTGGCVVLVPQAGYRDPDHLVRLIRTERVSTAYFVCSMLRLFLEYDGAERCTGLTRLLCGGEPLPAALAERVLGTFPNVRLHNLYGPSESAVSVTGEASGTESSATVPIGRPPSNVNVYILDRRGAPVAVGVAGELFLGGAQLARGYLGRPGLTAERFIANPFGAPGTRLYRTGDLARWRPSGTIEFLGRDDHQVKVRGFRVELGEIEARLSELPRVREAVVLAGEESPGVARLVAYVVCDPATEVDDLRAQLSQSLPDYMLPAAIVRLEALPLLPNGKLDRLALPAPAGDAYSHRSYEAPVGERERALADIWSAALGVARVGRRDNFFELGGHSLLAVQMAAQVRQALGVQVPLAYVFSHPTLEGLAGRVWGETSQVRTDRAVAVRASGSDRPLFLAYEGGGTTAYAQVLHPHVDSGIPIYALPAPGPAEPQLRTIEGMATRLVRMIRDVQPSGPYRVAGWSLGGVLAYEIASQLIGDDEEVEFVGLFDSRHPSSRAPGTDHERSAYPLMVHLLQMSDAEQGGRSAAPVDTAPVAPPDRDLEAFVERCRETGALASHVTVASARAMLDRVRAHERAMDGYSPLPIPCRVDLFSAERSRNPDPTRGWASILGEGSLSVTRVPGTHTSMMGAPLVESLGREVSRRIARRPAEPPPIETGHSPALKLRRGDPGKAPVFCVPGAGASVTSFIELAGHLDGPVPVYGLEPRGLDGTALPHSTVPAAAAHYLRALCETCPEGGVHLLGHSFGGWVALEMALRLREAGRTVASLTILDSDVPDDDGALIKEYDTRQAFLKLVDILELTADRSFAIEPTEVASLDESGRLALLHRRMVHVGLMNAASTHEVLYGPLRTFSRCLRTTYQPSAVYPDRVRLVLVRDPGADEDANLRRFTETVRGWKRWAPNLTFHAGPGNHATILKAPYVEGLLAELGIGGSGGAVEARA